jgi:NAD(P)-dependent dehydrogenase (short-subunit alcohol dehydrogenase family)
MSKTSLITGASSGFGRDTAETLFRAGHTVYATMRGTQGKKPLRPCRSSSIQMSSDSPQAFLRVGR